MKQVVESLGGKSRKWESIRGLPDQICMLPGGTIFFVETKSQGEGLRGQQELRAAEITILGQRVYKADTKADIDAIIKFEVRVKTTISVERLK